MKQTLLTLCLIVFALPSWGQTTFSGGNISGGKIGSNSCEAKNNDNLAKKHLCATLQFSPIHLASEITLIDKSDLNNDGIEDFIIGLMVEPFEQLGIKCCEIPSSRLSELKKLPAYLVLSSSEGYKISMISNSESFRTWAGEFFHYQEKIYFYLGRNGEIGLPQENIGEKSVLFEVINNQNKVSLKKIWEAKEPTVTSSVSTYVDDDNVYILENNYGKTHILDSPLGKYETVLYNYNSIRGMNGISLPERLKPESASNAINIVDYNEDNKLDLIVASEVWKSLDGKETQTKWPESYIVSNFMKQKNKIKLYPAEFNNNHSGMAIQILKQNQNRVIIEASTEFKGHQGGGFTNKSALNAYDINNNFSKLEILGKLNTKKGTFRDLYKFLLDNTERLAIGYYSGKPQMLSFANDKTLKISNISIQNYDSNSWVSAILPLKIKSCVAFATIGLYHKTKTKSLKISNCVLP